MMDIAAKKALIQQTEATLPAGLYLIYYPPMAPALYTAEEIAELVRPICQDRIPPHLGNVQRAHWVKKRVVRLLGYAVPTKFRGKLSDGTHIREVKPKFRNQLLDVFVQASNNLQVWNYVPYADLVIPGHWNEEGPRYRFSDCRYLIIHCTMEGHITHLSLKHGYELRPWDRTGTQTIKWQANALRSYRERIRGRVVVSSVEPLFEHPDFPLPTLSLDERRAHIAEQDRLIGAPLVKMPPDKTLLFTSAEIGSLMEEVINTEFPDLGPGQERLVGQFLEKRIVEALGYQQFYFTDTGGYPDLLHQLVEVKFQYSGTIDLGRNLPTEPVQIEGLWNIWGLTNREIRYVVCLVERSEAQNFQVESVVVCTGVDFNEYFSVCEGTNFKVQLVIPASVMLGE